jgi:hypothetical protein
MITVIVRACLNEIDSVLFASIRRPLFAVKLSGLYVRTAKILKGVGVNVHTIVISIKI